MKKVKMKRGVLHVPSARECAESVIDLLRQRGMDDWWDIIEDEYKEEMLAEIEMVFVNKERILKAILKGT